MSVDNLPCSDAWQSLTSREVLVQSGKCSVSCMGTRAAESTFPIGKNRLTCNLHSARYFRLGNHSHRTKQLFPDSTTSGLVYDCNLADNSSLIQPVWPSITMSPGSDGPLNSFPENDGPTCSPYNGRPTPGSVHKYKGYDIGYPHRG